MPPSLQPAGQAAGQEPRPARPGRARPLARGCPARRRHRRDRRHGSAGRPGHRLARRARHREHARLLSRARSTRAWSSTPPASRTPPAWSPCRSSSPRCCAACCRARRVVVLGAVPEQLSGPERVAQRALEGFTRSLGKEIGRGSTVQLVYVAEGAEPAVDSTLAFLLSPKSAYVSGQVVRIGATGTTEAEPVPSTRQAAGRQGRDRHRRLPRHRRADRPGAAP